jgi:tetratricopeptide (TPR) repeat protein
MSPTPPNRPATTTALTAALAIGTIICAWQAVRLGNLAASERAEKERAKARCTEAESAANFEQVRADESQAVLDFFQSYVLVSHSPHADSPPDLALRQALIKAESKVATYYSQNSLTEAAIRSALAVTYQHLDSNDVAVGQLQRAVELRTQALGPRHPATLRMLNNLAVAYRRAGRYEKAIPLLEETLRLKQEVLGSDDQDTIIGINNLGMAYNKVGSPAKAIALLEPALQRDWSKRNANQSDALACMKTLAKAYLSLRQFDRLMPLLDKMLLSSQSAFGKLHPETLQIMGFLTDAYHAAGEDDKVESICRELVRLEEQRFGPEHPNTHNAQLILAINCLARGRFVEAEKAARKSLDALQRLQPDDWTVFNAKSILGAALLGQAKADSDPAAAPSSRFTTAETLLQTGYQGLIAHKDQIPYDADFRIAESIRQLIDLYTAWQKPDEAAKWQAELDLRTAEPPK